MSNQSTLVVEGLRKSFGGVTAVEEVSFEARLGQVVAVIGPNGAGKTTLFNMISGLLAPDAGQIHLNGQRLDRMPPHKVAEQGVARTFQNVQLFGNMTVLENVMMGRHRHGRTGLWRAALGLTRREEAEIRQALEKLMEGRTTFIIAHRIQSVMNADLILVLDKGRIVQHGTHDELMAQEGMYRQIYDLQARIEDELQQELESGVRGQTPNAWRLIPDP